MLGDVRIRFIRRWRRYMPGRIIQPPAGLREQLLQRGYAELVIDEPETTMVEPATEKAVKKRGRPRTREYVDGKPVRKRKKVTT